MQNCCCSAAFLIYLANVPPCSLQQNELQLFQQSQKLSLGRGSGLLPLADSNTDAGNADMRTVQ